MNIGDPYELTFAVGPPVPLQSVFVGPPSSPAGSAQQIQYVHTQTTPATVWTVVHNLGRRPSSVSVFSLDFAIQWDEFTVQHLDLNQLRVSADVAVSGIALIE